MAMPSTAMPIVEKSARGIPSAKVAPQMGWLMGRRWRTSIGAGIWPVRPRVVMSKVVTLWSSAHLKRMSLGVVLDPPLVPADHAEQISHRPLTSGSTLDGADVTRAPVSRSEPAQRPNHFRNPLSCAHNCAWPDLGSAALASTIGKSGRTAKPTLTSKCAGAVMLSETRDALHGGQIPETPSNWANRETSDHGSHRRRWVWPNRTRIWFERGTRSRHGE
jgi:hypothetical protein